MGDGIRMVACFTVEIRNGDDGIIAGSGSTVAGNAASNNSRFGILLFSDNLVDGNTAVGNTMTNIGACPTCTFGLNQAP